MTIFRYIWCLVIVFNLSNCQSDKKQLLPHTYYESTILVVLDKEFKPLKDSIQKILFTPQKGLPRMEPKFDLQIIPTSLFKNHLKSHMNILFIEHNKEKSGLKTDTNKWAHNQHIIQLFSKQKDSIITDILNSKKFIENHFHQKELLKLTQKHKKFGPSSLTDELNKNLKIKLYFDQESFLARADSTLFWARKEQEKIKQDFNHQVSQGLFIKKVDYLSALQADTNFIVDALNDILNTEIQGTEKGVFMEVSRNFILPSHEIKKINGFYTVITRGLWRMNAGLRMGGPFIHYFIVDKSQKHAYHLYGYAYGPEVKKRSLINNLEASIYSFYNLN